MHFLITLLVSIAALAFIFGIYRAIAISWPENPNVSLMPVFLSNLVVSIAAILATNLGVVLGFNAAKPDSPLKMWWNPAILFDGPAASVTQKIGCYLYILGLLAAAITWARKNFNPDETKIVSLIPQLTKSLVGVIIGALAFSLNVPQS